MNPADRVRDKIVLAYEFIPDGFHRRMLDAHVACLMPPAQFMHLMNAQECSGTVTSL